MRLFTKIRSVLLGFLVVLSTFGVLASAETPARKGDRVFVGYLFGASKNIDYRLYTHLCHAFLTADADGKILPARNVPDRVLTAEAHTHGVKVLLSLGGWGWDEQFAAIVSKPESEERYISSVLRIVDENDYDGIDLDWEYPDTKAEVPGFERLTRSLRKGLDAIGVKNKRTMQLTMAASSNAGTLSWLDTKFLLETMDWVNVMTYDYAGDWTDYAGHNSPLFGSSKQPGAEKRSAAATIEYLMKDRSLPADRIALGIPLYGRGFPVKEPYASTQRVPKTRLPRGDFSNLHKLLHEQGWTRTLDDETKVPWLHAPDHSAVIGYDDAESVGLKTDWAMKKGLRGVFFWQIHADRLADGSHPLQEASHKEFDSASK